jgi:hypothetical protein
MGKRGTQVLTELISYFVAFNFLWVNMMIGISIVFKNKLDSINAELIPLLIFLSEQINRIYFLSS